jgi:hypothetical protein
MSIQYVLQENTLPFGSKYRARTRATATVDLNGVIDRMLEQGSTITRGDILAVLENYHQAIERLVLEGRRVITPAAVFFAGVGGTFTDATDGFDPQRHELRVTVTPARGFRQAIRSQARVTKTEAQELLPAPQSALDRESGKTNETLTPGGVMVLGGKRLKFDEGDTLQGVFLINTGDESITRVRTYARNLPSQVSFVAPALPAGQYRLELRSALNGAEQLRIGRLKDQLTVA